MASVRLAEVVGALSLATDIGLGQPLGQGSVATILGVRLGLQLGVDETVLTDTYYLSTLRFIGCTADTRSVNHYFGNELDIEPELLRLDAGRAAEMLPFILRRVGAHRPALPRIGLVASALVRARKEVAEANAAHCQVARMLATRLGFEGDVLRGIDQAFERWDGKGDPGAARGGDLTLPLRIAQVAYGAALFWASGGETEAVGMVGRRAGAAFDPDVAGAFCAGAAELLSDLDTGAGWDTLLAVEPGSRPVLTSDRLDEALRACGDFADLKSPYTAGHSSGVAGLAAPAARSLGLPESDAALVRRAGWLHDLGRVGVSALVWDKPAALNQGDRECVRLHPYYTERVLAPATGLRSVADLAGLHHERLDGSGYHRAAAAGQQPVLARVLAAADAFHALTEPRPHRPALDPEAAAGQARRGVTAGHLDPDAVEAVIAAAGQRPRPGRARALPAGLTTRELEVLRLLARGLTKRQVADRLVVSVKTADSHVQHVYTKLGVSTRAAATIFAMQHGLVVD